LKFVEARFGPKTNKKTSHKKKARGNEKPLLGHVLYLFM